jgi:hypothetical protein
VAEFPLTKGLKWQAANPKARGNNKGPSFGD